MKWQNIKDKFLDWGIKATLWIGSLGFVGWLIAKVIAAILCALGIVCIGGF
jgi:hypothetical protein